MKDRTSIDTSMRLTTTGVFIMGNRSGDLDPGALVYVAPAQTEMMNVTGMKCGGCPIEFSLALKQSIGVEDVEISLVRVLRTPPAV